MFSQKNKMTLSSFELKYNLANGLHQNVNEIISGKEPAYCLYTSGSSGLPKGVLISHQALNSFLNNIAPIMNMSPTSQCLNTAPFFFDVSIIDTLFPLTIGAVVYLSPAMLLPNFILNMINQHKITHMCGVSSTLDMAFGDPELMNLYDISSLKTLMTGAEILNVSTLKNIIQFSPDVTIINGYGPTEATCVCATFSINKTNVNKYELYPIGHPLEGVDIKIVDEDYMDTSKGQLLLSGDQVMLGYLNNATANEKAFITVQNKIYYKTGDVVSFDSMKQLVFHGRYDTQIKLRGYRIDLNEIKILIASLFELTSVEIFLINDQLVASLCPKNILTETGEQQFEADVRTRIKAFLPSYMQPSHYSIVYEPEKLPSGKIDVKKLKQSASMKLASVE
jgi:acyl-CoA synthetase (AMP-forming)/AMP-acid ligase II